MRTVAAKSLRLSSLNYRYNGQDYLALTGGLGFSLLEPALLTPAQALGVATKSLVPYLAQGLTLDLGLPKKRGEFLAVAAALAPAPQTSLMRVAFSVGPLKREFSVLPERGQDGLARPFTRLELAWDKTEFEPNSNPYGQSFQKTQRLGAPLAQAQVMEFRSDPGGRLGQVRPGPASPLPCPLDPRRAEKAGTFGQEWLKKSWPGLPADFDFDYFNLAQESQRLKAGFFRGDEPISLLGLNAQGDIKSRLPGLRLRVVARKAKAGRAGGGRDEKAGQGEVIIEAQTNLDTIWLFPESGVGMLFWRAGMECVDEKNSDVILVAAALEDLTAPLEKPERILAKAEAGEPLEPIAQKAEPKKPAPKPAPAKAPVPPAQAAAPPPELQVPAVTPKPQVRIPAVPTIAAAVVGAKSILAKALEDINPKLMAKGLTPWTEADFTARLDSRAELFNQFKDTVAQVNATPEDELTRDSLVKSGFSPQEADNVVLAARTPIPERAAFPSQEAFEKATMEHGELMGRLFGQPPEVGQKLGQKLIQAQSPDLAKAAAAIDPDMARIGLATDLKPGPEDWAKMGMSSTQGERIVEVVSKMEETVKATQAESWAGKMAALNQMGPEMEAALGLAPGTVGATLAKESQKTKTLFWGSEDLTKSLETLAKDPEKAQLAEVMPQLTKLRKNPPLEANSLVDLGLMVGLTNPRLLSELGTYDLLNPQYLTEKIQALEKETPAATEAAVKDEPPNAPSPESRPGPWTRALVEERLKDPQAGFAQEILAGLDLSGLDFSGRDLSQVDLRECQLAEANFAQARLGEGVLAGADLSRANLTGASLLRADLTGAKLAGAQATGADFSQASLDGADLGSAILGSFQAPKASLEKTLLPRELAGANLVGARLRELDLSGVNLAGADLTRADLRKVNLQRADLGEASLTKTTFDGCDLSEARMVKVKGRGLKIGYGQNLGQVNFNGADLRDFVLLGNSARGTSFQGVQADGANLREADLSGSDWTGSSLKGAVLFRGDLRQASFARADLFQAVLGGADLRGTNFGGSSLYSADFYRANVDNFTNFKGADLNGTLLKS
ncbi:MAG: pentapeptide repeat-containing protein [Deltaproteobacteria bacterium]|jgi:uncharacterized protein YjbI with pentapeptide repeats|nr:pentapeptide repeat-containing protein [Deltaproteobacteria bacterium]